MGPTNPSSSTAKWVLVIAGSVCILSVLFVVVLMAVALPMMRSFNETARRESVAANLKGIESALRNYEMSMNPGPSKSAAAGKTIDTVREIVAKQMGVEVHRITPSTSLAELRADDLDMVELIMELEEHFSVSILDESTPKLDEKLTLKNSNGLPPLGELTMLKLAELVDLQRKGENK